MLSLDYFSILHAHLTHLDSSTFNLRYYGCRLSLDQIQVRGSLGRLVGWEVGWCKDSSKRMRGPALNKKVALRSFQSPAFGDFVVSIFLPINPLGELFLNNLGYCWWKKSGDHLGCKKPCIPINWCRISSINNIFGPRWSMSQMGTGTAGLCRVRASGF